VRGSENSFAASTESKAGVTLQISNILTKLGDAMKYGERDTDRKCVFTWAMLLLIASIASKDISTTIAVIDKSDGPNKLRVLVHHVALW